MESQQNTELLAKIAGMLGNFSQMMNKNQSAMENQQETIQNQLTKSEEDIKKLVNESQQKIRQETKQAVNDALVSQTEEFEKRLKFIMNDIDEAFRKMNQERKATAMQTKLLTWKGVIGLAVGMTIIMITSLSLSWDAKKKRDEALEELDRIVKTQKITNADQHFIKTMCGESVCIKVDPKSARWGENKEYVIPLLKD